MTRPDIVAPDADDFEFDEVGSDIVVSPTKTTEWVGMANQAALTSG